MVTHDRQNELERFSERVLSGRAVVETLGQFERGRIPKELVVQAKEHTRESAKHRVRQKAHEKIKTQQRKIIAKWKPLMNALAQNISEKWGPQLPDH